MGETDAVMSLVRRLSRYLREHPQACDTPDGMARWWLGEALQRADVVGALEWMERAGVVERLAAADGRVRYRRVASSTKADARLEALARGGH